MYIRKGEKIRDGLQQKFQHQMQEYSQASARKTLGLVQSHTVTPADIQLISFLYKVRMATRSQIIAETGITEAAVLDGILKKLLTNRLINRFMVCDEMEPVIKPDAEFVYTVNGNGVVLIDHYTDDVGTEAWAAGSVTMTSTKVNKVLMGTDFYLALKKAVPGKIRYYTSYPSMFFRQYTYHPIAVFSVQADAGERVFVLEGASSTDIKNSFTTKFTDRIGLMDRMNANNTWSDYTKTNQPPIFFFISDNLEALSSIARLLANTSIKNVRYCTADSIKGKLSEAFFKYDGGSMTRVYSRMFE